MACLDENQVVALVHGRLTGEALRAAQEHLDQCLDCLDLVGMFQQTTLDATQDDDFVPLTESLQIDLNAPPGSQIGRYEVIRSLGRGGMGVVYLARDPQLDRAVALKLVRPSLQEDERADHFERRLMREARAMAKLSHPNVLTIFDVGLHGEQVFLASEWIDGCTLDEWMIDGPHRWRSVVKRFAAAASGLAAAHRAGLVHRDFKPSNVMLGKDERVHVFDFGLVKAIQPSVGDITTQLSGQFVVGTPAYMSPEQMTGEAADERSDQFSFCVALYEALAGRRPFSGRNITELLTNIGIGRFAEPKKIPKWLWDMLRKGLARDPNDRHDSMRAIVAILDRGIRHSKRRMALATGAFGAAAAVAAGLGYWSGHSGTGEPEHGARPGVVAAKESKLNLASDFERMEELFGLHKYEQVIEVATALLPKVETHRPSEARLWAISARSLAGLGRYEDAAEAHEKCFYAAVAGRDDEMAAVATAEIFELYAVRMRDSSGAERWRSLAESAVERAASVAATAKWQRIRGSAELASGSAEDASNSFSESLATIETSGKPLDSLKAAALQGLGRSLAQQGELTRAREIAEQAVSLWKDSAGARHPRTAFAQVHLAETLMLQGDLETARQLCENASDALVAAYGEAHPRVAQVLNAQAAYAVAAGDVEAANQTLLRALKIKRGVFGDEDPRLASTLINLMDVDRMRGRPGDAVIHGGEAVKLLKASRDTADVPRLLRARLGLAEAQLMAGQGAEALATCRALHARFETLGGVTATRRGRALSCMGQALVAAGQTKAGIAELERAMTAFGAESSSQYRALTLFVYAKNNADDAMAKQQAKQALDDLAEAGPGWAREHGNVKKWLEGGTL